MRKKRMRYEGPGEKKREGENTYYIISKKIVNTMWIGKHRENKCTLTLDKGKGEREREVKIIKS